VPAALVLPRLDGGPLVLRAFITEDAAVVVEAGTDPVIPLISTVPRAPTDATAVRAFIARQT
jgi:[ribosomal protein S5]-alanine N-acetyltransferase